MTDALTTQQPQSFFDAEFLKRLERLHLIAKRLSWAGAKGEHPASRKGFSLEFSDYRTYQRGYDLRYVDWNIYRRFDRLLLKVFTAEEELNVYLMVDTSGSMAEGEPVKIDYARKVAAAFGYIGLKNIDRGGGAAFFFPHPAALPAAWPGDYRKRSVRPRRVAPSSRRAGAQAASARRHPYRRRSGTPAKH